MPKDTQSRKWQITINNPEEKKLKHEDIKEILQSMSSVKYWCMADEIGEKGTYHTHLYIYASAIRFSTIKNKFNACHIEMAKGTSEQNKEYITKTGKWEKDKKKETNLADTFEEFGELPLERQGQRNDLNDLYDMIKHGFSNYDILEVEPTYMLQIDKIERVRQILKEEEYRSKFRNVEVTYIWGKTGSGKTRAITDMYEDNYYRVTDYLHPFDSYKGQDCIILEEFRSDLKIGQLLTLTEGYPTELPCRYNNKVACYTKVFILSNIPINCQYMNIQFEQPETWKAFLRRIKEILYFTHESIIPINKDEYIENNYNLPKIINI